MVLGTNKGLEFEHGDWVEQVQMQKEQIVDDIAAELSREHPDIFDSEFFQSQQGESEEKAKVLVRQAVMTRQDLAPDEQEEVIGAIMGQATGYGVLQEFFAPEASEITEIFINPSSEGPKVFYSLHGRTHMAGKQYFKNDNEAKRYCQKICEDAKRPFTENSPIVDAWLKDGSRIAVVGYKPSPMGVMATIRKSPTTRPPMPLSQLVDFQMLPPFAADMIIDLMVTGHANIGVWGRTDSGKTTFLRSLAGYIDDMERTFIAETSFELFIPHLKNCVNLTEVTYGDETLVDMTQLCKTMNRNNPDRSILGELRSKEVIAASQIASSCSGGFWTTGHAGDVNDLRTRLFGMFLDGGVQLPREFLDEMISSMFDFLIFLDKETITSDRKRTLMTIEEVLPGGGYNTILEFDKTEFAETKGKHRRWIYKNPITENRLGQLAFSGANMKPEYRTNETQYVEAKELDRKEEVN